jgi:hypothetical protein
LTTIQVAAFWWRSLIRHLRSDGKRTSQLAASFGV